MDKQKRVTAAQVFKGHAANIARTWVPTEYYDISHSGDTLEGLFHTLALAIAAHCGDGGPTTHSLNRLRESQMWAMEALSRRVPPPELGNDELDWDGKPFHPNPDIPESEQCFGSYVDAPHDIPGDVEPGDVPEVLETTTVPWLPKDPRSQADIDANNKWGTDGELRSTL